MMMSELALVSPEFVLLTLASIILVVETMTTGKGGALTYSLCQATLVIVIILVLYHYPDQSITVMSGSFVSDSMSATLKLAICIITLVVFFYSYDYLVEHEMVRGEYFILGLFSVLGMSIMVSANSLLTVYLGLELLSLSLYSMVAMNRDSPSASEAAMKYFVLGAIASGMLLYGISILYGVSGTLELPVLAQYISGQEGADVFLIFGLVFVLIGVAFKLGAVPFHMWIPDVYEGSPTSVTLFISTAPKLAAFAMAIRLLTEGMGPLVDDWQGMLIILSVLSMAAGNIIAIAQTNIKRMLAYSTISHIGFMLLGILSGTTSGYAGSMFYIIVYALMSMGAFGMVILMGRKGSEADMLEDYKGLSQRSPWFAFIMMILMFSLAGVPPFIGFWSKWFVIMEVIAIDKVWLAAVAVIFSVIGAFYYLRIIKLMYFDKPEQMRAIKASQEMRMVLSLNGLSLLLLGLAPGILMSVCIRAIGM